jgi:hypothetical protein
MQGRCYGRYVKHRDCFVPRNDAGKLLFLHEQALAKIRHR